MRAGTMRDRITLLRWGAAIDARWGSGGGWTSIDEVWAGVAPVNGSEKWQGQGVQSEVTHTIRMRYRPDLTSKDRIIYRNRTLEIVSVIDVEGRRRELLVEAREHPMEGGDV